MTTPTENQPRVEETAAAELREAVAILEQEIAADEAALKAKRERRNRISQALGHLDPAHPMRGRGKVRTAANAGTADKWRISPERVERTLEVVRKAFDGQPFNATQVAEVSGLHITSAHKLLKLLHDSGRVRLDHLGGERKTTRFYALPTDTNGGE